MAHPSPHIRRKRLGSELRRFREQARLTCDDVGRRLDCSGTRISRIETGRIRARPGDVRELLALYGVTGADVEHLVQLARDARRRGWWQAYGPGIPPWLESYLSLESEAAHVRAVSALLLPALVRTEDYARAALVPASGHARAGGADADRSLALLRERQARALRPGPPRLTLVIGEGALHAEVGGPDVHRRQLHRLAGLAAQPAITLQVLPLRSAALGRAVSPFTVLEIAKPGDEDAVYLEYLTGGLVLDAPAEVQRYRTAFAGLQAGALGTAESAALIGRLASPG